MKTKITTIQIPVNKQLRDKAKKAAAKQGFSSLQEALRVFLKQLAEENILISFGFPDVHLSAKNDKRYTKMEDDVKSRKVKTKKFTDVHRMMQFLNE